MKKLIAAYRENDLFVKYMPEVIGLLSKEITTEKFVFPAGTDVAQLRENLESALKDEKGFVFLHDTTCDAFSKETRKEREIRAYNLDEIFSDCASKAVREVFGKETNKEESFLAGLKKLAKLVHTNPTNIYIVEDHLADHFRYIHYEKRDNQTISLALKKVLKEVFPVAKIAIVSSYADAVKRCANNQDAMIVVDRHCDVMENDMDITQWPHKTKLFMFPLENAANHLFELKKLSASFDAEAIFKEISRIPVLNE